MTKKKACSVCMNRIPSNKFSFTYGPVLHTMSLQTGTAEADNESNLLLTSSDGSLFITTGVNFIMVKIMESKGARHKSNHLDRLDYFVVGLNKLISTTCTYLVFVLFIHVQYFTRAIHPRGPL